MPLVVYIVRSTSTYLTIKCRFIVKLPKSLKSRCIKWTRSIVVNLYLVRPLYTVMFQSFQLEESL